MLLLRRLPDWWLGVFFMLLGLWLLFSMIYWLGGDGISYSGADVSFDREHDVILFRIDDDKAFCVGGNEDYIDVLNYKTAMFPFNILCGTYQRDGKFLMGLHPCRQGDWIYADDAWPDRIDRMVSALNLKTGETLTLTPEECQRVDEASFEQKDAIISKTGFYADRGFVVSEETRITFKQVVDEFDKMSTFNESSFVLQFAFMALFALMFIIGFFSIIFSKARPKPAATTQPAPAEPAPADTTP